MEEPGFNNRVLICDDNRSIHDDLLKILKQRLPASLDEMRAVEDQLFGDEAYEVSSPNRHTLALEIDHAYSSREAIVKVQQAAADGRPYALVFMDVRMPPGADGVKTIKEIWEILPNTEVVIVTAYSDYSWDEIIDQLGVNDKLLYLRKPFSSITVKQIALNLTQRWNSSARLREALGLSERPSP